MMLIAYSIRVLRWAQFARGVRAQHFRSVGIPSPVVREETLQEALYNEMLTAERCLLEAIERQHVFNRVTSKSWNESIASSLREARQLVDSAADDYVRATQRFRSSALNIRFSTEKRLDTVRLTGNALLT